MDDDCTNVDELILQIEKFLFENPKIYSEIELRDIFNLTIEKWTDLKIEDLLKTFNVGFYNKVEYDEYFPDAYSSTKGQLTYMHNVHLHKFFLDEVQVILEDFGTKLEFDTIMLFCEQSFRNYFDYNRIGRNGVQFELVPEINDFSVTVYKIISTHPEIFYIVVDFSKPETRAKDFVGLKKWADESRISRYGRINYAILSALRRNREKSFSIDRLVHRLNRLPFDLGIDKPMSHNFLLEVLNAGTDFFEFDKEKQIISMSTEKDLARIIYYFKRNKMKLESAEILANEYSRSQAAGLIAVSFAGEIFPLPEAVEYVKLRPIIYIAASNNIAEQFRTLISSDAQQKQVSEFLLNLQAILPVDVELNNWISQNLEFSFYHEFFEWNLENDLLLNLIGRLSPILNLKQNQSNLFRITLEDKVAEYQSRQTSNVEQSNA